MQRIILISLIGIISGGYALADGIVPPSARINEPSPSTLQRKQEISDNDLKAAKAKVDEWLKGIDAGRYSESWENVNDTLKERTPREKWIGLLTRVRDPLGPVKSREALGEAETKGSSILFKFRSVFENMPAKVTQMTESVVATQAADGKWLVGSYLIKH